MIKLCTHLTFMTFIILAVVSYQPCSLYFLSIAVSETAKQSFIHKNSVICFSHTSSGLFPCIYRFVTNICLFTNWYTEDFCLIIAQLCRYTKKQGSVIAAAFCCSNISTCTNKCYMYELIHVFMYFSLAYRLCLFLCELSRQNIAYGKSHDLWTRVFQNIGQS